MTIYSLQVIKYLFETLSFNAKFGMYQVKLKLAKPRGIKLSSDIIVRSEFAWQRFYLAASCGKEYKNNGAKIFFEFIFVYFLPILSCLKVRLSQNESSILQNSN